VSEPEHPAVVGDPLLDTGIRKLAAGVSEEAQFGELGPPLNRQSPFMVGFEAALGVAAAALLAETVLAARQVLVLIGLATFLAVGLDPAVRWVAQRRIGSRRDEPRRVGRRFAVLAVVLGAVGTVAGFITAAVPPISQQISELVSALPRYARDLEDHHSALGRLNARYHLTTTLQAQLAHNHSAIAGGLLGAGKVVLNAVGSTLVVGVLTVYFLVGLPGLKRTVYRLVPRSRRARVGLITDEVLRRVGGYVLGNLFTSLVAGVGTVIWLEIFRVPYPVLLGLFVALLDLVPIIGSSIGGAIVSLVALSVSLPVAIATAAFYVVYRLLEDYLLTPKVMKRTVNVAAVTTILAVLLGGALLGIIGALVAIPFAAALQLIYEEVAVPRLDGS